jgi:hypothetical protein
MKKLLSSIALLAFVFTVKAQTLPEIKTESLTNKNVTLPADLKGKYSLLCFASSTKAQGDLESWLDPVYQKYIAKTGIMDDMFDVNVYFIPVLTGTNFSFAASMKKKFYENSQEDLRPHVLFCNEEGKGIIASLNMQKSEVPYFFLLDKDGKIIYRTTGKYTEEKFDAIDELIN